VNQKEVLSNLKQLKVELQTEYPLKRIGIFGSCARTDHSEQSDIDIVVELEPPKMFDLIGIKQEIENRLQKKVDIVRYRESMNPVLKERIDKETIYV